MKTRKNLIVLIGLVSCVTLLSTALLATPAQAQKAVEWRMLSSWTPEFVVIRKILVPFVEKVNKRSAGKLKISILGPEAVPSFEQLKPVREGLFNACFTNSAYHVGEISLGQGMDLFEATGKERRAAGIVKIVDEAYRKKVNVTCIAAIPAVGYHIILRNQKIDKADLTGLKIRTSPFYDPLVKALGGAPVRVAAGEIYTALEKGVVDGSTWPILGALDYKWYEVAKYMVRPAFGETVFTVLVNLDSWNRLSKDLQDLLTQIAIESEEEGHMAMKNELGTEEKELLKKGMELDVLPPQEGEKYLNTFYERSWQELILKQEPEFGPRLKEAVDRMKK